MIKHNTSQITLVYYLGILAEVFAEVASMVEIMMKTRLASYGNEKYPNHQELAFAWYNYLEAEDNERRQNLYSQAIVCPISNVFLCSI